MRPAANLALWTVWGLYVAVATFAIGVVWFPQLPVRQPLAFNHVKHQQVACVVCHRGVETRAFAGIPEMDTCLNCHATPPEKTAADIATWNAATQAKHIAWQTLTRVPQHVYFSHRRHVELGQLDCATCHGDIAQRAAPPPHALKPISMANCLACHEEQHVINDCARCHK